MLETEKGIEMGREICELFERDVRRATNDLYELLNGGIREGGILWKNLFGVYNETR